MPTFLPPSRHADVSATLGQSFQYLESMVRLQLAEQQNLLSSPLLFPVGDLAGSGADTARIRRATGIGWAASMTAMSSETETIIASSWSGNYDAFSVGRYGLAFEETFQHAGLQNHGIDFAAVAASIPSSLFRQLRSLACTTGVGFNNNKADDTAALDVDDAIALRAAYEETSGFDIAVNGRPWVMLHTGQISDLRASMRSETALKFPERFDASQGLQSSAGLRFTFLDMDFYASNDVAATGGDWHGFSGVPGKIGWVHMSTGRVPVAAGSLVQRVPEVGLIVTMSTEGAQAYNRMDANAWLGTAALDDTVAPGFLFRSNQT